MPSTSNGISNGHHYDRKEARKEALELNNRRNELENEIKEYMSILDSVCFTRLKFLLISNLNLNSIDFFNLYDRCSKESE